MKHIVSFFMFLALAFSALNAVQTPKILSPEEAFQISALQNKEDITIRIGLGEGIYLYDDKIKLEITQPLNVALTERVSRPSAEQFHDFMTQRKPFSLVIPRSLRLEVGKSGDVTLKFSYQGCSEIGLCYQPMENSFTFTISGNSNDVLGTISEQDRIASALSSGNRLLVLVTFFGFGLLLALTPCVFPMIPILSSIIVSQPNASMNAKKGFLLSLVYVLAMSLAYAIAGVLAGLFGANLQASMQNPWVISIFSALFVLLALSLFGFFEIAMPSFIQTKISQKSNDVQRQGFAGIAMMGFLSALIVGPCVAAPMAGALIYIGQSGDALLGGLALFVMSLGMGVPLLVIGTTAGKYMPRPGGWMENVTAFFGVMMLGVAIWMLSRIVPEVVSMSLWAILIVASSVYAGALEPLKQDAKGWQKLFKSLMVMVLLYGASLVFGLLSGGTDPLHPFEKFTSKEASSKVETSLFAGVKNIQEINEAVKKSTKPVMLDFYADWCVNCIEYEKFTFSDERVKAKMAQFTLLKADVTKNNLDDKAMQKEFGIFGPPAILFFKDGQELKDLRLVGYKNADEFLAHLAKLGL